MSDGIGEEPCVGITQSRLETVGEALHQDSEQSLCTRLFEQTGRQSLGRIARKAPR
jgi:hypothetical protein